MRELYRDIREEKLEQKIKELAETGDWQAVIRVLDEFDANNERRHSSHRADMDITLADREPREG